MPCCDKCMAGVVISKAKVFKAKFKRMKDEG